MQVDTPTPELPEQPPGSIEPQLPTPNEQLILDEATIFDLASCMMEIHVGSLMRNKQMMANAMMRTKLILMHDPSFLERFKKARRAVDEARAQAKQQAEQPAPPIATP